MKQGFLGTAAPPYANVTLLLEIAMGVALLIGAFLARRRRFRQHAWCQSVIVLLNLAVIGDDSFFSTSGHSKGTPETREGLLRSSDGARDTRIDNRNRGIVHSFGRWQQHFAGQIPHHQVQALDANGTSDVVGRASIGIGNLHSMVRPAFFSKMKSNNVPRIIDRSQHRALHG